MQHPKMKYLYCGVDTHKLTHSATIINCFNDKLGEITFENKLAGFKKLEEMVGKHITEGLEVAYGLEDTGYTGKYLAEFLMKRSRIVKKVDSTLSYSERRNSPITHKTDEFDSLCIARVLLNKLNELPDASFDEIYCTLSAVIYRRKAMIKARSAMKNQLHVFISNNYPAYKEFFKEIYCKTALKFWDKYPSPSYLESVTVKDLGEFLKKHSNKILGEDRASIILAKVLAENIQPKQYQKYTDYLIKHCIEEIDHINKQVKKLEEHLKVIMGELPYKLHTLPGLELVSSASIIAEIGDISRFKTADKLSKYAGISPITYSSGSKDRNFRNRQGNRILYRLIHDLAGRSINTGRNKTSPVNEIFLEYWKKKISEGKTEHQATIAVMRRLIAIIFGMMKHKREYNKPEFVKKANVSADNIIGKTDKI